MNRKPRSFMSELRRGTRMAPRDGFKPRATIIEPVDLLAEKRRRETPAHEREGSQYEIARYVFDGIVGVDTEGKDRSLEVLFVTDGALSALGMSARDAIRLGEALIEAAHAAPSMKAKPVEPEAG
jgi:hypothetical protein